MKREKRPLEDWLGQRVRVSGYVDRWEVRGDREWFLVKNVNVCLYKNSDPAGVRSIDHVWLSVEPQPVKYRLKTVRWVGNVVEYFRADGSRDYAIEYVLSTALSREEGDAIRSARTKKEVLVSFAKVDRTITALENETYNFPAQWSYDEEKDDLFTELGRLSQMLLDIEAESRQKNRKQEWMLINRKTA